MMASRLLADDNAKNKIQPGRSAKRRRIAKGEDNVQPKTEPHYSAEQDFERRLLKSFAESVWDKANPKPPIVTWDSYVNRYKPILPDDGPSKPEVCPHGPVGGSDCILCELRDLTSKSRGDKDKVDQTSDVEATVSATSPTAPNIATLGAQEHPSAERTSRRRAASLPIPMLSPLETTLADAQTPANETREADTQAGTKRTRSEPPVKGLSGCYGPLKLKIPPSPQTTVHPLPPSVLNTLVTRTMDKERSDNGMDSPMTSFQPLTGSSDRAMEGGAPESYSCQPLGPPEFTGLLWRPPVRAEDDRDAKFQKYLADQVVVKRKYCNCWIMRRH
jgi:hypothetical protein